MERVTMWITLAVALIGLVTALISLWISQGSIDELSAQKVELAAIKDCHGEVAISIEEPQDGGQVSSKVNVIGSSTPHETCRYVFVAVHDASKPGQGWKISDLTQVNKTGRWTAKVRLNEFTLGTEVEIDARVSAQPKAYVVGQHLSVPLERGVPSNIIHVRRVQ